MIVCVVLQNSSVPLLNSHHESSSHANHTTFRYHNMQPGGLDGLSGLGSMDPLEALLGPFPCARVRGLPFEATVEDVLVFFQGLVVIDVVLVSHADAGEAFVIFANPMDFQMGLQR
jgi:heterogeneous nuclear ribonucleoprotein F/H